MKMRVVQVYPDPVFGPDGDHGHALGGGPVAQPDGGQDPVEGEAVEGGIHDRETTQYQKPASDDTAAGAGKGGGRRKVK